VFPESDSDLLGANPFAGGFLPAFPGEERPTDTEEMHQSGSKNRKGHSPKLPQYPVDSAAAASTLGAAALALPLPLENVKEDEGERGLKEGNLKVSKGAGPLAAKRRSLKRIKKLKSTAKGGLEAWATQQMEGTRPWRFVLRPGDTLLLPAGCAHAFRVISDHKDSSGSSSSHSNHGGAVFLGRNFVDASNHRRALLSAANAALHPLFAPPSRSRQSFTHKGKGRFVEKNDDSNSNGTTDSAKEPDQKASSNTANNVEIQDDSEVNISGVEVTSHGKLSGDGHNSNSETADPEIESAVSAAVLSLSSSAASDLEAVALLASLPYLAQQAAHLSCCREHTSMQSASGKSSDDEGKKNMDGNSEYGDNTLSSENDLVSTNVTCPWTTALDANGMVTAVCIENLGTKSSFNNKDWSNASFKAYSAESSHSCKGTDSECCLASVEAYLASCIAAKKMYGYSFDKTISLLVPWLAIGGRPDESLLNYHTPIAATTTTAPTLPPQGAGGNDYFTNVHEFEEHGGSGRRVTHVINCLSAAEHPAIAAAFEQQSDGTNSSIDSNGNISLNGDARTLQLYLDDDGDDEKLLQVLPSVLAFVRSALHRPHSSDITSAKSPLPLIYVHCKSGVNRAPSVAIALLVALEQRTLMDAFALVRTLRPSVRPKYLAAISRFEEMTLKQPASAPALRDGPSSAAFAQLYSGLQDDHSSDSSSSATAPPRLPSEDESRNITVAPFRAWPCAVPELTGCNGNIPEANAIAAVLSQQLLTDCYAVDKVGKTIVSATAAAATHYGSTNAARSSDAAAAALPSGTFWLPAGSSGRFGLESMVAQVFEAHTRGRNVTSSLAGAEWWVKLGDRASSKSSSTKSKNGKSNRRRKGLQNEEEDNGGAGFHFDSDSTLLRVARVHRHPPLSTVTYLSTGNTNSDPDSSCLSGSPTMVLDWTAQQLRDQTKTGAAIQSAEPLVNDTVDASGKRRRAWLAWPSVGQHIAFYGHFMHGAPSELRRQIPCHDEGTNPSRKDSGADGVNAELKKGTRAQSKTKPSLDSKAASSSPRVVLVVNIWLVAPPFQVSAFPISMARNLSQPGLTSLQLESTTSSPGGDLPVERLSYRGGDPTVIQVSSDTPRMSLAISDATDFQAIDGSVATTSSARVDAAFPAEILRGLEASDATAFELTFAPGMEVRMYG